MRVFVTGASGHIGMLVVAELQQAGHQVVGLARSDASAARLTAAGAGALRGTLDDLESLREAAAAADGVIHLAFIHDFSDYARSAEADRRAIEAIGEVLAGSDRPLIVTSGTGGIRPGHIMTEDDTPAPGLPRISEATALALVPRGVRASVMRLPPSVHGPTDLHGFVPTLINIARAKGVAAYVGDGANRWPAVHNLDAAHLYLLALEQAPAGTRLHGVGDEGIPFRQIAESIGRHLNLPTASISQDEALAHFGWIGALASLDIPASSALTQQRFGWRPVRPGLIADLDEGHYFNNPAE
jgi:nucleoside-diphosphate-sugar epimerase